VISIHCHTRASPVLSMKNHDESKNQRQGYYFSKALHTITSPQLLSKTKNRTVIT
jgi:hypothetical protein